MNCYLGMFGFPDPIIELPSYEHRRFRGFGGNLETLISFIEKLFLVKTPPIKAMLMSFGILLYSSYRIWLVFCSTKFFFSPTPTFDVLLGWLSVTRFLDFNRFKDFISFSIRLLSFLLKNGFSSDFLNSSLILKFSTVYWTGKEI